MEAEQKPVTEVAIRFLSGPLAGQIISIQKPVAMIGRDGQNDIVVFDPRVSRHYACIRWLGDSWAIENLSQNSYVAINQQRTQQGVLQHNSVVSLGEDTSFVFLVQQPVAQPPQPTPGTQLSIPSPTILPSPMEPPIPAVSTPRLPVDVPPKVSPSGTALTPLSEFGLPSLTVSSNIQSDQQVHIFH